MLIALLQAIVSGLAVGSAYALIALGFSITFTTTKTLNFSHGDFVSVGAFIGVSILWLLLGKPINSPLSGVSIANWPTASIAIPGMPSPPPAAPPRRTPDRVRWSSCRQTRRARWAAAIWMRSSWVPTKAFCSASSVLLPR